MRAIKHCLLVLGCLYPSLAFGQMASVDSRPLSGKQLFERRWTSVEPTLPNLDKAQELNLALRSTLQKSAQEIQQIRLALGDGLGPLYNAESCAECHPGGGGSGVKHNVTHLTIDPRSAIVHRTEDGADTLLGLFPTLLDTDGTLLFDLVVHNRSTRDDYDPVRNGLKQHVPGGIDDAWFLPEKRTIEALANQPVIAGRLGSIDFYLSQRNPPALFGLGIIATVDFNKLNQLAARQAEESGGTISGRAAGRFGWRGQGQSLSSFVSLACNVELGLSHDDGTGDMQTVGRTSISRLRKLASDPSDSDVKKLGIDMSFQDVHQLAAYVAGLPQPVERAGKQHSASNLLEGEKFFYTIGCAACHVADLHPARGLFTDLLLHDMGSALQAPFPAAAAGLGGLVRSAPPPVFKIKDPQPPTPSSNYDMRSSSDPHPVASPVARPEQPQYPRGKSEDSLPTWDSLEREWRTPPLWGVADSAPYLHDGRAATLEEAIMWHGGEGAAAKDRFAALTPAEKERLLSFLSTLRAPTIGDGIGDPGSK